MKIRFLCSAGNFHVCKSGRGRSPHYSNLQYLGNNPALKTKIQNALGPYFNDFFSADPYLNSGKVSAEVCRSINVSDDQFHHGLVGSLIYESFRNINPTTYGLDANCEVVAS